MKRVQLRTILAGPGIGPHDAGDIVDLDDSFASRLIKAGCAVEVPVPPPVPRRVLPETAVETFKVETTDAIKRGRRGR